MKCISALALLSMAAAQDTDQYAIDHTLYPTLQAFGGTCPVNYAMFVGPDGTTQCQHIHVGTGSTHTGGTASPTKAPTAMPLWVAGSTCTVGSTPVDNGWHGAGSGSDYCNLWKCVDGTLDKSDCGSDCVCGIPTGTTCAHTSCAAVAVTGDDGNAHTVIHVTHDHQDNAGGHAGTHSDNTDTSGTYFTAGETHSCGLNLVATTPTCTVPPCCTCTCTTA
jgi:hypothetical protein